MLANNSFVELCLTGKAYAQEIDDYVHRWHESDDPRTLQDYLGFNAFEYAEWLKDSNSLTRILFERKIGQNSPGTSESFVLAARTSGLTNYSEVLQWINEQHK